MTEQLDDLSGMSPDELRFYFEGLVSNPISIDDGERLVDALCDGEGRVVSPDEMETFLSWVAAIRTDFALIQAALARLGTFRRNPNPDDPQPWVFEWKEPEGSE
jgi:hypothetical protein